MLILAGRRPALPVHHRGGALEHLDAARMGEALQPIVDRVAFGCGGELVGSLGGHEVELILRGSLCGG